MRRDACVGVSGENDSSNLKIRPVQILNLLVKERQIRFAILLMLSSKLGSRLLVRQVQWFDRLGARV